MAAQLAISMTAQGAGTWEDLMDVDPHRNRMLKESAVNKFEVYTGNTETEDIESTFGLDALSSGSLASTTDLADEDGNAMADPAFSMHVGVARVPLSAYMQGEVVTLVLKWCHEMYLLEEKHLNLLQRLSSRYRREYSSIIFLKNWLNQNEGGGMALVHNVSLLYSEYHAAHLQRIFLHAALLLRDTEGPLDKPPTPFERKSEVACLGSFPLHHLLGDPHHAGDIDLWVQSTAAMYRLLYLYHQIVVTAIGGSLLVEQGCPSSFADSPTSTDAETLPEPWIETSLDAIWENWDINLLRYLGCSIKTDAKDLADFSIDSADDEALKNFFVQAKNHLPQSLEPRPYRVSGTWRLKSEAADKYESLRSINIILLDELEDFAYGAFHETVSAGFDLMHCRLALKVESNLSFSFHAAAGIRECALRRKLVLMPTSFQQRGLKQSVEKQFKRLHKYFLRDFDW